MFQNQPRGRGRRSTGRHLLRVVAPVACALTLLGLTAGPSSARPDAGEPLTPTITGDGGPCLLERVGTQFVRCDVNTGNGVPAPAWIPER
jgi:hypothetical protein